MTDAQFRILIRTIIGCTNSIVAKLDHGYASDVMANSHLEATIRMFDQYEANLPRQKQEET